MKKSLTILIIILSYLSLRSQTPQSENDATTSIYDIQYTEDESGDSPEKGNIVTTIGLVYAIKDNLYWITSKQNGGKWTGLCILNDNEDIVLTFSRRIKIKGKIIEKDYITCLSEIEEVETLNNPFVVVPKEISITTAKSESYESCFVKIIGVCTNPDAGNNTSIITSELGDLKIDKVICGERELKLDYIYQIFGVMDYASSEYRLLPRFFADIFQIGTNTDPLISIRSPSNLSIIYENSLEVEFITSNIELGIEGKVEWQLDNGDKNYTTTSPILLTDLSNGTHIIEVRLVDNDNNPLNSAVGYSAKSFEINISDPEYTSIHEIQYSTPPNYVSPLKDEIVWVKGIVTASFNGIEHLKGYYIQDVEGEWNGIFVSDEEHSPNIGDSVSIRAKVKENNFMTSLDNQVTYLLIDNEGEYVSPSTISIAQAKSEEYESCLVQISNVKCINASDQYGHMEFTDGIDSIKCRKNKSLTIIPSLNDYYTITGVMHYLFNTYFLIPRLESDIQGPSKNLKEDIENQISIHPNPAKSHISISIPNQQVDIIIYNISGQEVLKEQIKSKKQEIDISSLKSGSYIARIISKDISIFRKLIVSK